MTWIESAALYAAVSGVLWMAGLAASQQVPLSSHGTPSPSATVQPSADRPEPTTAFPTFNSQQLDQQFQRYLRVLAESGPPDILIVGSSRANQGIDPIALQNALAQRGYPNLKIFNFGVNGATAQVVDLILQQLLTAEQLPRLIVWADGSRAFNSGRIDRTYSSITASLGYQSVAAGVRPTAEEQSFARTEIGPLCLEGLPALLLNQRPAQKSTVPKQDHASRSSLICGQPLTLSLPLPASMLSGPPTIADLQAAGFNPRSERFKPDSYFRRYPKVAGDSDGDYRDFTLEGQQTIALRSALKFAYSQRIPVIFVNLPLTTTYLDETRSHHEQEFRRFMQRFATYNQLVFYDFTQRQLSRDDYFVDPSHLNRYGAEAVSRQLAENLVSHIAKLKLSTEVITR